jgi:selenocysteine-specific elongation factor
LKELASSIDDMLVDCPPKKDIGKARLPIDRVFTLKGFGTIVTGTLIDGQFDLGQQVELLPVSKQARIRGIQSHKKKVETAFPGNRTALNLVGLDADEIRRGDVLANPGTYRATTRMDAKVDMLADASGRIKHNDHLKCFIGAAESIARIRVLGKNEIAPGDSGWVQMEFDDPIVPAKGDYLILRRPSPAETIAGGIVLEPHPERRYKRFSEKTLSRLALMDSGSQDELLVSYLEAEPLIPYKEFITRHELKNGDVDRLIGTQIKQIGASQNRGALVSTFQYWHTLKAGIKKELEEYYQKFPLRPGIPGNELNKHLKFEQKKFNQVIDEMVAEDFLSYEDDVVALADHAVEFSEEDKKNAAGIINEFEKAPYTPPSLKDLSEEYNADLVDAMCGKGMLVKLTDDIAFTPAIYRKVIADTRDFLKKEGKITLAQFRDNFNTSRKYALALLEHMDAIGMTLREDDFRVLK